MNEQSAARNLGPLREVHDWVLLLEDPAVSEEQRAAFKAWCQEDTRNLALYERAQTFHKALGRLTPNDLAQSTSTSNQTVIPTRRSLAVRSMRWLLPSFALSVVAAICVLLLPHRFFLSSPDQIAMPIAQSIQSEVAETKRALLGDGTNITVGPATTAVASFTAAVRDVELSNGAAYFEVASEAARPFRVVTEHIVATALGTEFDVRARKEVTRVAVVEGTVEVRDIESNNVLEVLRPGDELVVSNLDGAAVLNRITTSSIGAWRTGRLVYTGASVGELLDDARRYSDVPIRVADGSESILNYQVRGVFLGENVTTLLDTLATLHPVKIDYSNSEVILLSASDPKDSSVR